MENLTSIETIAGTIQMAVAPVFLLAGIAGFLNVLSIRLGRIVDRARVIELQILNDKYIEIRSKLEIETASLWRRIHLINWAIRLCAASALTVCLVIVAIFIGEFVELNISLTVALLFIWALLLLAVGMFLFQAEVSVSTKRLRKGLSLVMDPDSE